MQTIDTRMAGREDRWTSVGSEHPWKQREDGVILPPIWAVVGETEAPGYFKTYAPYVEDLTREDYAFLTGETLSDFELSVDFQIRYGAVLSAGVAFRAQDSRRMYCVEVIDLERKGYAFHVSLWLQDGGGFRGRLAEGIVPHPEYPDRIRQHGPSGYEEWLQSCHGWSTLRVRATGPDIEVSIDGKQALACNDNTYSSGACGLTARWAIPFRNFTLRGTSAEGRRPWRRVPANGPEFLLPFDGRLADFEVYPSVTHDSDGVIYVAANVGEGHHDLSIGIVRSTDGGRTWVEPRILTGLGRFQCGGGMNPQLYARGDGRLICQFRHLSDDGTHTVGVAESSDGGASWSSARELVVSGQPLSNAVSSGAVSLYSSFRKLKDGTLLMCGYHFDTSVPGGKAQDATNAERLDRGFVIRSTDDGATWTGPHFISQDNFDNNECDIVELPDGRLQVFMRTLRSSYMWTGYSCDGGLTWTPLTQSTLTAECPCVLNHSSGTILMGSRGAGIFVNVSRDGFRTWEVIRVSPASGMMGMTELPDGRVLLVYHSGYRKPARIRAQFLRVTPHGLQAISSASRDE